MLAFLPNFSFSAPSPMGMRDLRVVVRDPRTPEASIELADFRTPFTALADANGNPVIGIEPTLTQDGHLLFFHNVTYPRSDIWYLVNEDPSDPNGWSAPKKLSDLYHVDRDLLINGRALSDRYPIAKQPLVSNSGEPYASNETVNGAYPWISLDGTELIFVRSGDPLIVGVPTNWRERHVDGPLDPVRAHPFGASTNTTFIASTGMVNGFWYPYKDYRNALPYTTTKPVYPIFSGTLGAYGEVPMEDALDGHYVTVLRMNEMINKNRYSFNTGMTPDTSGNDLDGTLVGSAAFPIEAGMGDNNPPGMLGRAIYFGPVSHVRVDDDPSFDKIQRGLSAEIFIRLLQPLNGEATIVLIKNGASGGTFNLIIDSQGHLVGKVWVTDNAAVPTVTAHATTPLDLGLVVNETKHLAFTAEIEHDKLNLVLYVDGVATPETSIDLDHSNYSINDSSAPMLIGPVFGNNLQPNSILLDEFKLSSVARSPLDIQESAYVRGAVTAPASVEPESPEAVLGGMLFFDDNLSGDSPLNNGSVSCAFCHSPSMAFQDGLVVPDGDTRNTQSLFNRAHTTLQFWDGRAASLEEQVLFPLFSPTEMNNHPGNLISTLEDSPQYDGLFEEEYGSGPTVELVGKALAAFQRSLSAPPSPFDDYLEGVPNALTESQLRGLQLFTTKARCIACHNGPNFSNEQFHNTGFIEHTVTGDEGRGEGKFKTPSLRGISQTAPYMHDGSITTLQEVLDTYSTGGVHRDQADVEVKVLNLTADENADLVNFLNAL
jgi:cytochrome c peroxidase